MKLIFSGAWMAAAIVYAICNLPTYSIFCFVMANAWVAWDIHTEGNNND
jgi:hypothetical protein